MIVKIFHFPGKFNSKFRPWWLVHLRPKNEMAENWLIAIKQTYHRVAEPVVSFFSFASFPAISWAKWEQHERKTKKRKKTDSIAFQKFSIFKMWQLTVVQCISALDTAPHLRMSYCSPNTARTTVTSLRPQCQHLAFPAPHTGHAYTTVTNQRKTNSRT